jgi:caffeoyl-CoA O-methyltransferase
MPVYNDELSRYVEQTYAVEDEVLQQVRAHSRASGLPEIHIRPEEGRFLQFLVAAGRVRRALEIGTLGGYSGIWIARGLGRGGRLITFEREPGHARVARENFDRAGVSGRVEIRVGEAHRLLRQMPAARFDFIFIDAEKRGYPAYLRWASAHLSRYGLLAAHNAFRRGGLLDPADTSAEMLALRQFHRRLARTPGWISTVFPGGDGMAIAVSRPRRR